MDIVKEFDGDVLKITVTGRLETATAPELDAVIKAIPENVTELTLDFTGVEYVSSAGLRVILTAQKTMNARHGKMALAGVNTTVKHVFDITGFTPVLTFV